MFDIIYIVGVQRNCGPLWHLSMCCIPRKFTRISYYPGREEVTTIREKSLLHEKELLPCERSVYYPERLSYCPKRQGVITLTEKDLLPWRRGVTAPRERSYCLDRERSYYPGKEVRTTLRRSYCPFAASLLYHVTLL